MTGKIREFAENLNISLDEFVGEMRKRGCSEPTAIKIWNGDYEKFSTFSDNDINLSTLRKAADVLKVTTKQLLP